MGNFVQKLTKLEDAGGHTANRDRSNNRYISRKEQIIGRKSQELPLFSKSADVTKNYYVLK